jgi:hypothetical protein
LVSKQRNGSSALNSNTTGNEIIILFGQSGDRKQLVVPHDTRTQPHLDELHVQPHALALRAHHAAGLQRLVDLLEERLLEQHRRGAHRVRGVHDDAVVRPREVAARKLRTI